LHPSGKHDTVDETSVMLAAFLFTHSTNDFILFICAEAGPVAAAINRAIPSSNLRCFAALGRMACNLLRKR
jgi:hypothetical protein